MSESTFCPAGKTKCVHLTWNAESGKAMPECEAHNIAVSLALYSECPWPRYKEKPVEKSDICPVIKKPCCHYEEDAAFDACGLCKAGESSHYRISKDWEECPWPSRQNKEPENRFDRAWNIWLESAAFTSGPDGDKNKFINAIKEAGFEE